MRSFWVSVEKGPVRIRRVRKPRAPPGQGFAPGSNNGAHPFGLASVGIGVEKFQISAEAIALKGGEIGLLGFAELADRFFQPRLVEHV